MDDLPIIISQLALETLAIKPAEFDERQHRTAMRIMANPAHKPAIDFAVEELRTLVTQKQLEAKVDVKPFITREETRKAFRALPEIAQQEGELAVTLARRQWREYQASILDQTPEPIHRFVTGLAPEEMQALDDEYVARQKMPAAMASAIAKRIGQNELNDLRQMILNKQAATDRAKALRGENETIDLLPGKRIVKQQSDLLMRAHRAAEKAREKAEAKKRLDDAFAAHRAAEAELRAAGAL